MRSSPCKDCPERFIACSDHCPKDERGEYGYKAWRADLAVEKKARQEYNQRQLDYWTESKRRAVWHSLRRDNSHAKKKFK
jgi:hypothetical protein